ncbi:hypothetical protein DMENIID0001_141810 [Sergentomyia squamirostris]
MNSLFHHWNSSSFSLTENSISSKHHNKQGITIAELDGLKRSERYRGEGGGAVVVNERWQEQMSHPRGNRSYNLSPESMILHDMHTLSLAMPGRDVEHQEEARKAGTRSQDS